MHVEQTRLQNGLLIVTAHLSHVDSASVGAFVNVGARHETVHNNGIAHFLEHMAFKGTETRTAYQISQEIEILGSNINAFTSRSTTGYHCTGLASNFEKPIRIIGDVLTHSKFDPDDITLESDVIMQEISRAGDSPSSIMWNQLDSVSYPEQPVGRPILGDPDFVRTAKQTDFQDFVARHYTADNIVVIAAGNLEHDTFVTVVEDAFAALPSTSKRPPLFAARYVGGVGVDRDREFKQVTAGIAFESSPVTMKEACAESMLAQAFGGGMSSPLFVEVREKRGLVYSVGSFSSAQSDHGRFIVTGGMAPDKVSEFITVSMSELRKLKNAINEVDFTRARNVNLTEIARVKERPMQVAMFMAHEYWGRGEIRDLTHVRQEIESITLNDMIEAAERVIASPPAISLVGPAPKADYLDAVTSSLV